MAISCAVTDNQTNTTDQTSFTFSGMDLGTAAAGRYIIALVSGGAEASSIAAFSSVTIGGVSATLVKNATQGSGFGFAGRTGIFIAAVPSGATGDVVVNWAAATGNCSVAVLRVTGLDSAEAFDVAADTGDPNTASIDVPAGGLLVGTTVGLTQNPGTVAWTNLAETYDLTLEGNTQYSGAFDTFATVQTNRSVTSDWTGGLVVATGMALASFSPRAATDATVNLTGVSASGSSGAFAPSVSKTITGVLAATTAGTFGKTVSPQMIGAAATGAAGSLAISTLKTLTGVAATAGAGAFDKTIEAALVGVSAIGHAGDLGISVLKTLTGIAATGQVGTFTPEVLFNLLGVEGTMALGALVADTATRINLVGASATGSAGTFTTAVEILLAGNGMTGDVGALTSEVSAALQGVAAQMGVGDVTVSDGWARIVGNAGNVWTNKPGSVGNGWAVVSNPIGNAWTNKN